jgi:hypothetical protein
VAGPFYRADFPDAVAASDLRKTLLSVYGVSGVTFVQVTLADVVEGDPTAAPLTDTEIATAVVSNAAITTIDTNIDTLVSRVTAVVATASDLATVDTNVDTLVSRVTAAVATASALTTVDNEIAALQSDVTAIKDKTDDLTFTVAGVVDANATHMNDAAVTGNGTSGNLWRGA